KTDDLIQLIRTMTRAEKRHFRLFAKRNQASGDILFLQVFDILDKKGEYDETYLLKKIKGLKKGQLSNLKAHLMRQLLTSLRMLSIKKNEDIQIREAVDFARVLYDKGLYRQSLDLLAKAKERALANHATALGLEILEFEKLIEGQFITRSLEGRAEELAAQTLELNARISKTNRFSNLSIRMYGLYLKNGFARNEKDSELVKNYFDEHLPDIKYEELDFLGKVYFCQSHVWLHHICQEFLASFRYSQKWVSLFAEAPRMKALFAPLYLKGVHNLLFSLFHNLHYERFLEALALLGKFPAEVEFKQNANVEGLFHLYRFVHLINKHYLEGTFTEGVAIIPQLAECIESNRYRWDGHRIMVFNYRIACLYFGDADYPNAIEYLNKIINEKVTSYRSDIQCFARILCLIAHFELGNRELVEYLARSVYRFLLHVEELQAVQKAIFQFLRQTQKTPPSEILGEFKKLHAQLLPLEKMHFESRPFLYLDIISWLEAKMEGSSIQEVIRRKFLERR
ncbi:MAG TPA: hypothetical protein ENJ95_02900, partial [Bacteroidetes bacterium]|nr:hypothetical protein [Bacteroidota bacterium]